MVCGLLIRRPMGLALRSVLAVLLLVAPVHPALAAREAPLSAKIAQQQKSFLSGLGKLRSPFARGMRVPKPRRVPSKMSFSARASDAVAGFAGSWKFITWSTLGMGAWMLYNTYSGHPFDKPPFIGLNLLLSTVAALQAPFILMSQNRQAEKDRERQEQDYNVNVKAEQEIQNLHNKVDLLSDHIRTLTDQLAVHAKQSEGGDRTAEPHEPAKN
jgi:uncharacterized membrane protein